MAFPVPPAFLADEKSHRRALGDAMQGVMAGRLNVTTTVTLDAGTATTLEDPRISLDCVLVFQPLTASAAGTQPWASAQAKGTATLNHPAGAADRTYRVLILG